MARTRGGQESSKRKASHPRSLRDQLSRKRGGNWMNFEKESPAPLPQASSIGMENTPSLSFSLIPLFLGS